MTKPSSVNGAEKKQRFMSAFERSEIMKPNEIVLKDGNTLCAIVSDRWGGGCYHAIIYKEKRNEFVFCSYYDIKTGEWLQGYYVLTYEDALNCMINYLKK